MNLVSFRKSQPDWQPWVDAYGFALTDEECATREVACDGGCLVLCEGARSLVGAEGGGRGGRSCATEAAVVVEGPWVWKTRVHTRCRVLGHRLGGGKGWGHLAFVIG